MACRCVSASATNAARCPTSPSPVIPIVQPQRRIDHVCGIVGIFNFARASRGSFRPRPTPYLDDRGHELMLRWDVSIRLCAAMMKERWPGHLTPVSLCRQGVAADHWLVDHDLMTDPPHQAADDDLQACFASAPAANVGVASLVS
jgi:hypothetical protein